MKDALLLLDAIHLSFSHPEYQPFSNHTFCNAFINEVCLTIGFKGFNGMLANEICIELSKNVQWSEEKNLERCQDLANGGTLIIAGYQDTPHGHVCVICPGKIKKSGRWGNVPTVANVGRENFIGKGINWAFSALPKLYVYRPTL